jgi:trimethylguanosine synthase
VIAFALSEKWERIIAIEKNASTLACAQHNAQVYGVLDAITWVHGDSFEYLAQAKSDPSSLDETIQIDPAATTVFASPPWGGVNYKDHEIFDLSTMEPYNLEFLYKACHPMEHVLFLPRTSDIRQVAKLVPDGAKVDVVQYCMEGASKAMVAYMPAARN